MDGAPQMSSLTRSFDSNVALRSPTNTPQLLQSHLYEAFLSGETADISLRVSGSWNAVYRLHRIVLTQAVRSARDLKYGLTNLSPISLGVLSFSLYLRIHGRFIERECRPRGGAREVRSRAKYHSTWWVFDHVSMV